MKSDAAGGRTLHLFGRPANPLFAALNEVWIGSESGRDDQRHRLAVLGKQLGRKLLGEWASIVTPDTILRWHRQLIAATHDFSDRRGPGRPPVINLLRRLVVRMALENPFWGYDRIEGEIKKLGHRLSPTTVRNILKANGIEPSPERRKRTRWREFLRSNWSCLAAADCFTVEVWSCRGLVTYYVLFVMDLATRRVHGTGITRNPYERWMMQIARDLTDPFDGFLLCSSQSTSSRCANAC